MFDIFFLNLFLIMNKHKLIISSKMKEIFELLDNLNH